MDDMDNFFLTGNTGAADTDTPFDDDDEFVIEADFTGATETDFSQPIPEGKFPAAISKVEPTTWNEVKQLNFQFKITSGPQKNRVAFVRAAYAPNEAAIKWKWFFNQLHAALGLPPLANGKGQIVPSRYKGEHLTIEIVHNLKNEKTYVNVKRVSPPIDEEEKDSPFAIASDRRTGSAPAIDLDDDLSTPWGSSGKKASGF